MKQQSSWQKLKNGNQRFVLGKPIDLQPAQQIELRKDLGLNGQSPEVAVLTCADSRLSPELIFDCNLGDLFVVRIAGNIATSEAVASLEFTVSALKTKTIVVLGHSNCGAVGGAFNNRDSSEAPKSCLEKLLSTISQNIKTCSSLEDAINSNVRHTAKHLAAQSKILSDKISSDELEVIPAVYDLKTGLVTKI